MHPLDSLWTAIFLVVATPVFIVMTLGLWLAVSAWVIGSNAIHLAKGVGIFVRGVITTGDDA